MARPPVQFGISGFGYAFGEDQDVEKTAPSYVPDPERVMAWGYHTFHRAADGVTAVDLAAEAAQDALTRTGLSAGAIDLVVLAASEVPGYLNWDSSTALARQLNIPEAQTMLLNEGCASGVTGLGVVAGLMAVRPELETVLFAAVNRVSEYHRNRMTVNNAVHSDGAAAAVLRRGHERNQWLATEQIMDAELTDWFRTDYGGAVAPVAPAGWSAKTAPAGHERVQAHFKKDPKRMRAFGEQAVARSIGVIDAACRRAGVSRDEVSYFIYINDPDGINDLAPLLKLPLERTNHAFAAAHGHMGAADQLTALGAALEQGALKPGDLVALTGISIGMRWYCTLVQA
jgi:3-oxoacyl-[acyl-carrier-protein] synthase-3